MKRPVDVIEKTLKRPEREQTEDDDAMARVGSIIESQDWKKIESRRYEADVLPEPVILQKEYEPIEIIDELNDSSELFIRKAKEQAAPQADQVPPEENEQPVAPQGFESSNEPALIEEKPAVMTEQTLEEKPAASEPEPLEIIDEQENDSGADAVAPEGEIGENADEIFLDADDIDSPIEIEEAETEPLAEDSMAPEEDNNEPAEEIKKADVAAGAEDEFSEQSDGLSKLLQFYG